MDAIGDKSAYTGESVSFSISGKDPDKLDRVSYSLVESTLPGAELDAQSGRFSGRAERPGDYQVVVAVIDDGFPPQTQTQKVRISVSDRPPAEPPREVSTPKPSFALAKFAFVTAITEVDGRRQVWISLRTEGKIEKKHEGEQLRVGEVPVTVQQIEDKSVVLEAAVLEKRFRVHLGQSFAEGQDLPGEGRL
jgi:hypothetical protein